MLHISEFLGFISLSPLFLICDLLVAEQNK